MGGQLGKQVHRLEHWGAGVLGETHLDKVVLGQVGHVVQSLKLQVVSPPNVHAHKLHLFFLHLHLLLLLVDSLEVIVSEGGQQSLHSPAKPLPEGEDTSNGPDPAPTNPSGPTLDRCSTHA